MSSLVLELQQDCLNEKISVTALLRKALVVATKLNIPEFKSWIDDELNGYKTKSQKLPGYRYLKGEIKATHPEYQWIPYIFQDPKMAEILSSRATQQPIGELEHLLQKQGPHALLTMPFTPQVLKQLDNGNLELGIVPTLVVDGSRIQGILDAVRNIVLQWSLRLEADGILGEALTFSKQEKEKASNVTYHIHNFTGVAGIVQTEHLQIGNYSTIHQALKERGISQSDRNQLEDILDKLANADQKEKPTFMKVGSDWVLAHAKELGDLAKVIMSWFSGS